MADRVGALIEYFESLPDLTGIPIMAPRLKDSVARQMPRDCIVISQVGGFGGAIQGMSDYHQRIYLMAYGATGQKAATLHDKVMVALNNLDSFYSVSKDVWLYVAELEEGAADDLDTGSNTNSANTKVAWPYVDSTWGLMTNFDE
ncbi:MAG: hypothetical protein BGO39_05035 [Chloroflexi bacterium 54-19]|nr:MAG: hypothetical protein BGO39_05035 [Chloroflexi bacterium 54-19]